MKNKKTLIAVIAVVAVLALLLGIYFVTRPNAAEGEKAFTLTIVHSDGTSKDLEITSNEEFLAPALIAEGVLTDEGIETGMYNTVDGELASWDADQAYWGFYINGEYAMTGVNDTPIEDGAAYKLEYTIG